MESWHKSRKIFFFQARSWAIVIAWIQTIVGIITMILAFVEFFVSLAVVSENAANTYSLGLYNATHSHSTPEGTPVITSTKIASSAIEILTSLTIFISGVILLIGISQRKSGIIKIWLIIQLLLLLTLITGGVTSLFAGQKGEFTLNTIEVFITLFCAWVVNFHRQELEEESGYKELSGQGY